MSDNGDFWKKLHAKRMEPKKRTKSGVAQVPTSVKQLKKPIRRRAPSASKQIKVDPFASTMVFDSPSKPPPTETRHRGQAKSRFTVTIDMVTPENRDKIRFASKSEGRSLSQWARRILLAAATEPTGSSE